MAQPPPPPPAPSRFETRAFTPIRNPIYAYNQIADFRRPQPRNVLESPPMPPHVDRRLTAYGSRPPVAGLTPIVPMAAQTPLNVWALYPA